jgi:hypothetical protein
MASKPRKPRKREDFNESAFRVVREATEGHEPGPLAAEPAAEPGTWTTPTEEETPPPKIS